MYSGEQKQIILKNSFGVSYHIYFDSNRGLCLRMLSNERIWSRAFVLSDLSVNDFCAILDEKDIIHFVFQTKDGRILYGHGRRGQIEIQPILNSKDTSPWHKHVSLLVFEDLILFFYVIRHNNRHLIAMQSIIKGVLSKPTAIDYIDDPNIHYLVFRDRAGKCHLLYSNIEKSRMCLNHRVLKNDQSLFMAAEKVHEAEGDILFPSAVCGSDNRIYLLFQVCIDDMYHVLFKELSMVKPLTLYSSPSPTSRSGLVYNNGALIFYRTSAQGIFYRTSDDEGISWTDEIRYIPVSGDPPCRFIYHTNNDNERSSWYFNEIPGSFSKGYQFAFLNEDPASRISPHKDTDRSKDRIDKILPAKKTESVKDEKTGTAFNDMSAKILNNKVILLKNLIENMQKELTKLWLTQKEYDKKLLELSDEIHILKQNFDYLSKGVYGDK